VHTRPHLQKKDLKFMPAKSNILPGKLLTPLQLGYVAGFLDGDGSVLAQIIEREGYVLHYQLRFTVSFVQKTKRKHFLMQLQDDLGKGTLRDRPDDMSELAVVGWQSVAPLLQQLRPVVRMKLKQLNLVLKMIEQLPLTKRNPHKFLELCFMADQVSNLNDSKNRKVTAAQVEKRFLDLGWIDAQKPL
jgi:hypothetical protein